MLDAMDAAALRAWCAVGLDALRRSRAEIDALNVYPVPDGDTGTNLVLTMESVVRSLPGEEASLAAVASAIARGALIGARGNSGVILSQLFRGFADQLHGVADDAGAGTVAAALRRGAALARAAVAEPVEGTVLSVASAAADAADRVLTGGADLAGVSLAAAGAARAEVARGPDKLAVLAAAGVVDAGGRGLSVLLDALAGVVSGEPVQPPAPAPLVRRDPGGAVATRESGSPKFGYEVQYLLEADAPAIGPLRDQLGTLGDSLVVVGDDRLWAVHVHVNDVGAAVEAGVDAGRPHRITVTRFADQIAGAAGAATDQSGEREAGTTGVVALAPAGGLARLFEGEGAIVVSLRGSADPSTAELLAAIRASGGGGLVVLSNDAALRSVAEAAAGSARREGRDVVVVPTSSPVQGLAALAVHDPGRRLGTDARAMAAAADSTRCAQVAVGSSRAGRVRPGDVVGMIQGEVSVVGADVVEVAVGVLERMLDGGGELVTVVTGDGAGADVVPRLEARLRMSRPGVQTVGYDGGQSGPALLIGVE